MIRFRKPLGRERAAWLRPPLLVLAAATVLETGCAYTNPVFDETRSLFLSPKKQDDFVFRPSFTVAEPEFFRSLGSVGEVMLPGNDIEILVNGDRIFPAMIADIAAAERSVNMETFMFEHDKAGGMMANALSDAARRGVAVRLTIDAWGADLGPLEREMREAGVQIAEYNPLRFFTLRRPGVRTHRKLLIVDGRIGYTGGVGIADVWLGDARSPEEWRDTHVRVTGPVVAQLQGIFNENWTFTTGEILAGDDQFPMLKPTGKMLAHAIRSSKGDSASLPKMLYMMTIMSARDYLHISNSYFIPDAHIRNALIAAAKRGVDVRVLVPGEHNDLPMIRYNSRLHYDELVDGGVKICEYVPTMMHSKMMVVDDVFATIGSINFDARSMSINAEESLSVYDREFAHRMEAMFQRDLESCAQIELEKWRSRGLFDRITERLFWIFEPYY